ncbi:Putative CDP-glycerol:glycerophosphate glycerophosphotransferase, partial [hydrothermal vent metagenome]
MNSSRQIHVALAFDNNFWAPAYTVMRSICFHTSEYERVEFHLCEYDVSDAHRADLDKIADEFGAKIHHYDVLQLESFRAAEAILPAKGNLHSVIYARMLLDHFVPETIKRIIYLDCDTMVATPIEDLFDADLKGHALGAVFDTQSMKAKMGYDIKGKGDIFTPRDDYFNSGVLVIDLDKYRK